MVVLAVIKVSSQSNGNGHQNYVVGMTTHANPCCAATTRVVSANTWLVVYVAVSWFCKTKLQSVSLSCKQL